MCVCVFVWLCARVCRKQSSPRQVTYTTTDTAESRAFKLKPIHFGPTIAGPGLMADKMGDLQMRTNYQPLLVTPGVPRKKPIGPRGKAGNRKIH